jgi:hypothetical protein
VAPDLALAYLAALSADIRDAVIASAAGEPLAGNPALLTQRPPDGTLQSARDARHLVTVVTGPYALDAVVAFDLRSILSDLAVN